MTIAITHQLQVFIYFFLVIDYKTLVLAFKHLFLGHDFISLQGSVSWKGGDLHGTLPPRMQPAAMPFEAHAVQNPAYSSEGCSELKGWLDQNVLYINFTVRRDIRLLKLYKTCP